MLKKNLYGIDLEYEFRIYKNIGKNYKKTKKRTRYFVCHTYTDWKRHVAKSTKHLKKADRVNFLHYVIGEKRDSQCLAQLVSLVFIPVFVAFLDILKGQPEATELENFGKFLILAAMCAFYSVFMLRIEKHICFLKDMVRIIEQE